MLSSFVYHRILRTFVCWMFKNAQGNLFIRSEQTSATYAKYDALPSICSVNEVTLAMGLINCQCIY